MDTLRTMQFLRICCAWTASAVRSAARGGIPYCGEVNGTGSTGPDSIASPLSYVPPCRVLHPLSGGAVSFASRPQAGAVCGNSARTDLCGGRSAMAVPTATDRDCSSIDLRQSEVLTCLRRAARPSHGKDLAGREVGEVAWIGAVVARTLGVGEIVDPDVQSEVVQVRE